CTLFQRVDRVYGHVLESLSQSARPANLYPVDFARRPQAEVDAHVAVRVVTGAAANLVDKNSRSDFYRDTSTDSIPIRFRSHCTKSDPVIRRAHLIRQ